jgi:hypothetical protein
VLEWRERKSSALGAPFKLFLHISVATPSSLFAESHPAQKDLKNLRIFRLHKVEKLGRVSRAEKFVRCASGIEPVGFTFEKPTIKIAF